MEATKTITVRFAHMPVMSLSYEFMVQWISPVETVPYIVQINHLDAMQRAIAVEEYLKKKILEDWHDRIPLDLSEEIKWMADVDSVELIACNLLTEKGTNSV